MREVVSFRRVALLALGLLIAPGVARALDPFEIQVYDGTANGPGIPGLELHVNRVFDGLRTSLPPLAAANHQTHFTLEPSLGLTAFWEVGAYLQSSLMPDGRFDFAGVKLRSKFVTPPDWHTHLRLGVNVEVSFLPRRFDASAQAMELRPIVAWETTDFLFAINPIIEIPLGSPGRREGPGFAPALMGLYKWRDKLAFGLEYYADFGPIGRGFLPWAEQAHYLFEVINLLAIPHLELNFGVGEGLTTGSNGFTMKMIVGYAWEREVPQTPPTPQRPPLPR